MRYISSGISISLLLAQGGFFIFLQKIISQNQKEKIKIPADLLEEFFPENFTEKQKIGLIKKLVEEWYIEQNEIDIKLSKR